jgi:hypothetical protein
MSDKKIPQVTLHTSGSVFGKTPSRISIYSAEVVTADGTKMGSVSFDDMFLALHSQDFDLVDLRARVDLTFGEALLALQAGKKVARSGWNGKGMFLYYVPANEYPAATDIAKQAFGEKVPYGAYIAMKTAQNNVTPWQASQADMLSSDWIVMD